MAATVGALHGVPTSATPAQNGAGDQHAVPAREVGAPVDVPKYEDLPHAVSTALVDP